MNAIASIPQDTIVARRAWLELLHARLRLRLVDVELEFAQVSLAAAMLDPDGALTILDDAMATLSEGGSP